MITNKDEALVEVSKKNPDMAQIDEKLFKDKDVVLAYMRTHSSNEVLVNRRFIDIDAKGMIDDKQFIIDVIKNLEVGYSVKSLRSLLKYSTLCIVKNEINSGSQLSTDELKDLAVKLRVEYNDVVKLRCEELRERQQQLKEIDGFIKSFDFDSLPEETDKADEVADTRYKRTDIGFTSDL